MADRICRVCGEVFNDAPGGPGRPAKDCQTCRRVRANPPKPPRPVETMVCWCGVSFKGRTAKGCLRHRRSQRPYGLPALAGEVGNVQCPVCQRGFTIQDRRGGRLFCSDWCANYWTRADSSRSGRRPESKRECATCSAVFLGTKMRRFCSQACRYAYRPEGKSKPSREVDCLSCGQRFETKSSERERCFLCRPKRDRRGKNMAGDPRSTKAWRVLRKQVLAEESECWICGHGIDPEVRHPHRMSGQADHVIPVSAKRPETYFDRANVRAAHMKCNAARANKMRNEARRAAIRERRLANERLSNSDSERRLQAVA